MHTRLALGLLVMVAQLVPGVGWAQAAIFPIRTPGQNAEGWNNTDVTVQFTCVDNRSALSNVSMPLTLTDEGADQSVTGRCEGLGGASMTEGPINIDKTPPVVTYTGNLGTYTVDQTVDITCTATDNLSGVESTTCADIIAQEANLFPR